MKPPRRNYLIAGTPRTGSSLLCERLARTGVAGRPAEMFAPMLREDWKAYWGLGADCTFTEYFLAARRHGTGRNGVFGVKLQQMHVSCLAELAGFAGDAGDMLELMFPGAAYVHLKRADIRAQAISWFRAIRTNEWFRRPEHQGASPSPPAFDATAILGLEDEIRRQNAAWERLFAARSITPLVVEYEALARDHGDVTRAVLAFLGLGTANADGLPASRLLRQADEVSTAWRARLERTCDRTLEKVDDAAARHASGQ